MDPRPVGARLPAPAASGALRIARRAAGGDDIRRAPIRLPQVIRARLVAPTLQTIADNVRN